MIFIDASRYNLTSQATGVENYSVHLINAMATLAPADLTLVSPQKIPLNLPQRIIPFPRLWTQVRLSWEILWNKKIQTLFVPSHLMPLIHPKNTVITIHDVAFKRFPEAYSLASRIYLHWGAKFAVKRAAKIIVPSQVTKNDLVEFYKADPKKIVVIPHGYTPLVVPGAPQMTQGKYFLFIGRIERKKNLLTLIRAFEKLAVTHPDFKLILAGKLGVGGEEIIKEAQKNPHIILTGYVNEATKISLLKNAFAFVLPSFYEGFGFPLLEAMQFNLPIIASDIPSSREVARDAALFFPPNDPDTLAAHMETVAEDEATKSNLTTHYSEILKGYSWEECAQKTLEVLQGA